MKLSVAVVLCASVFVVSDAQVASPKFVVKIDGACVDVSGKTYSTGQTAPANTLPGQDSKGYKDCVICFCHENDLWYCDGSCMTLDGAFEATGRSSDARDGSLVAGSGPKENEDFIIKIDGACVDVSGKTYKSGQTAPANTLPGQEDKGHRDCVTCFCHEKDAWYCDGTCMKDDEDSGSLDAEGGSLDAVGGSLVAGSGSLVDGSGSLEAGSGSLKARSGTAGIRDFILKIDGACVDVSGKTYSSGQTAPANTLPGQEDKGHRDCVTCFCNVNDAWYCDSFSRC